MCVRFSYALMLMSAHAFIPVLRFSEERNVGLIIGVKSCKTHKERQRGEHLETI